MNARSDGKAKLTPRRFPYGVSYRPTHSRARPWIVKFKRRKRTVYIGCFATLAQASLHADEFLQKECTCPDPANLNKSTEQCGPD